jgi:hypothetical protein
MLDPKDQSGFVARQKLKQAIVTLEKDYTAAFRAGKTDEAIAMVDKFIVEFQVTGEKKQSMLSMKMNPLLASQQFDRATKVIEAIVAIAPESQMGKLANDFKPRLEKMKRDAANQE